MNGPSTARAITLPGASVLHIRYAPPPSRPWAGRSPVQMAVDTARAAGRLETATSEELNFTQQQVLSPRRNPGDYGLTDSMSPENIQKIVDAFSAHVSTGCFVVPADIQAQRLGPEPPDSFALLRDRLENSILAMREAFRQVLHSLLKPLGRILEDELRAKLDPDARPEF